MFNGPANLRKFHRRKRGKSYSKDPYSLTDRRVNASEHPYENMRTVNDVSILNSLNNSSQSSILLVN